ncbi:MAG TPA: DUF1207 domain-containing protein [Candidatus Methylomirabilis sp.]|nr:DUF1207 domain-containing protein [Candidatus Methylomirabilis sp.]
MIWDRFVNCESEASVPMPETPVEVHALPEQELFAPLLADPRQPEFSMSWRRYQRPSTEFAASVALGECFGPTWEIFGRSGSARIGVQAAVFALFILAAPLRRSGRRGLLGRLSAQLSQGPVVVSAAPVSSESHLADEFILGNPGVNRVNFG